MTTQYVIGVDHGTGGCKVSCLDSKGTLVSEAYVAYPSYYPHPRWVEQDPEDWIKAAIIAINKALFSFSAEQRKQVKAIGFSASHHNAVLLGEQLQVLRSVIMWNDQRSGNEANFLSETYGKLIYSITNNSPTPTWTMCHLLWIKNHEPATYERIHKILFAKDYIRYRFSNELATDYIEAEGTLLYDIHNKQWSEKLCEIVSLDKSTFPQVLSPTDQSGTLIKDMAEQLGLPSGIPIIIGTADTAAEVYGSGTVQEGDGVVKLATAGNYTLVTNSPSNNSNIISYEHVVKELFYLNSATNFAAASFRWFKESFLKELEEKVAPKSVYSIIDEEIEKVPAGSEQLIFQPYLNGERSPHWDPYLRGNFFGITTRHNRNHFARSILEGVAYSIKDASLEFKIQNERPLKIIGGGAKGKVWVRIVADVLNTELEIPKVSDASFGVCLITATAIGWFSNLKEAVNHSQTVVDHVIPDNNNVSVYKEMFEIYQELHKQTKHLSKKLSVLHDLTVKS
jgi:xylulokinase